MANFHDVELLQNALQNAGESAMRRKQLSAQQQMEMQRLALESQLRDIQEARYQAQGEHFNEMQASQNRLAAAQQEHFNQIEKQYGLKSTLASLDSARQDLQQGLQGLALDDKMTPEQKSAYFKQSVDSIGDEGMKKQLLVNPQFNAIYSGQANWGSIAQQVQAARGANGDRPGATQQQIEAWRKAQADADDSGDPKDQEYADLLKNTLSNAPKPTQQTVKQYDEKGHPTNSITSFSLPGAAPAPDDTSSQRPAQPLLPTPGAPPVPANKSIQLSPQDLMLQTRPAGGGPSVGVSPLNTNGVPTGKAPTRAQAADYVNKYGQSGAMSQLQKDGFDLSNGYAD